MRDNINGVKAANAFLRKHTNQPSGINMTIHQLTRECRAIIETKHLFVSVFAVAGSGKTATLCNRICHLLSRGVEADKILVLSFSNKAVDVLRSRLTGVMPLRNIMTFHALGSSLAQRQSKLALATSEQCARILRRAIKLMSSLVKKIREDTSIDLRELKARKRLLDFMDATQGSKVLEQRLVDDPEDRFVAYAPILDDLGQVRKRYNRLLTEAGLIDYPGMLRSGRRALNSSAALRYSHVLVDEVQDMDRGQALLLSSISKRVSSVMVFGDPRQSIFGFAGSQFHDMRKILRPDVVELPLSRSFRLTRETAALVNAMHPKQTLTVPAQHRGLRPLLVACKTAREQERAIVTLVDKLKASGVAGNRIALLGRTKAQLRLVEQALLCSGNMTRSVHGETSTSHMQATLNLLTLLERNVDRLRDPLTRKRKRRLADRLIEFSKLNGIGAQRLQKCRRDFQRAAMAASFSGRYSAVKTVYLSLLTASGSRERKDAQRELNRWQAIADRFDAVKPLRAFVDEARLQPAVTSSTIHGAKGDEWDHVIVLGVTEGSLPFYRELNRGDIEEEKRLFYVAVTRARERVYLFHSPFHHAPSGQMFDTPSQFLTEAVRKTLKSDVN
jgi:DNA helicase-2/ATP-dependent DNA helicase PcrA